MLRGDAQEGRRAAGNCAQGMCRMGCAKGGLGKAARFAAGQRGDVNRSTLYESFSQHLKLPVTLPGLTSGHFSP